MQKPPERNCTEVSITKTTRKQLRGGLLTLLLFLLYQTLAGLSWLPTLECSSNLGFARSTLKIASGCSIGQQTFPSLPGHPFPLGTMLYTRRLSVIYQQPWPRVRLTGPSLQNILLYLRL